MRDIVKPIWKATDDEKNELLAAAGDKIVQALMLPVISGMIESFDGDYIQTDDVDVNIPCVVVRIRGFRRPIAIPNMIVSDFEAVINSYQNVDLFNGVDDAFVHPFQVPGKEWEPTD